MHIHRAFFAVMGEVQALKTGVVIAAAGSGRRMGIDENKVLLPLRGKPIIAHSLVLFASLPEVDEIVLVTRAEDRSVMIELIDEFAGDKPTQVVLGGNTRQESVYNGLTALSNDTQRVLIHDGARPHLTTALVHRVLEAVKEHGAVGVGVPVKDTIKQVQKGFVDKTLPRSELWAMQTPQGFAYKPLLEAHQAAIKRDLTATDDCALLEELGKPVFIVQGDYGNIKITTLEDLSERDTVLIGHGWDVHRLVIGRPLVLCGVEIPSERGLLGHSDADVAVHALMDAILGALGCGDIGEHFPDTDPAYRDVSSLVLLKQIMALLSKENLVINNADLTIMAEAPKLSPYKKAMRAALAEVMQISERRINIKATTGEGLGFVGRGEGIKATATVSLINR